MRLALLLLPAALLTACATQLSPVPDTWPKRYRSFLQEVDLPLGSRLTRYFGPIEYSSSQAVGTSEAIVVQFSTTNPISSVTVRFDSLKNGVYEGRMWTQFNRKSLCVPYEQLREVGQHYPGLPIYVHGHGPNGSYGVVRIEATRDTFFLVLEDGTKLEGFGSFEQRCLDRLENPITTKNSRW